MKNKSTKVEESPIVLDVVKKVEDKWVEEIEEYCSKEGIFPNDLIECHKNKNKALKVAKKAVFGHLEDVVLPENDHSGLTKMQLEMRKKKMGF